MADQAWIQRHLGQRYRDYLHALPNQEWYAAFKDHCEWTKRIAQNLQDTTRGAIESACRAAGYEGGIDAFVEDVWYERRNGISSLMQGGISRGTFDKAKESDQFWTVTGRSISTANPNRRPDLHAVSAAYTEAMDWMSQFSSEQGTSRFPAVVNRLFAGCLPGKLTSIVAENHFNTLLMSLEAGEPPEFSGNWLKKNWALMEWLSAALGAQAIEHDDECQRSIFFWWLYENLAGYDDRQVIYFGSPGTGKTWKAKQVAQARIKSWHLEYDTSEETRRMIGNQLESVQFHPSYGYEDFIEGIRPVGTSEGRIQLSLRDGIFKQFCRRAARWETNFVQSTRLDITDRTTVGDAYDRLSDLDRSLWSFFSDGLPTSDRLIDHLPPYFLIIDEINRAELSRVIGELMFSLEYRGSANKIRTQYAELVKDGHDDGAFLFDDFSNTNYFFVPHNLFLYGTMNTIDRSVESFDFALRRRFRWEELAFDLAAARQILQDSSINEQASDALIAAVKRLNESIGRDRFLGPDYCVGHAYFKHMTGYRGPKATSAYLEFLWHTRLEPLLREYYRGWATPSDLHTLVDKRKDDFLG